eukprot:1090635-Amphidinium_carterae.1
MFAGLPNLIQSLSFFLCLSIQGALLVDASLCSRPVLHFKHIPESVTLVNIARTLKREVSEANIMSFGKSFAIVLSLGCQGPSNYGLRCEQSSTASTLIPRRGNSAQEAFY